MTLENAIKTLDDVIPPHTHRTVDREHMPIALAWEAVKVELESRVPVVRCRDCKYWGDADGKIQRDDGLWFARCERHNYPVGHKHIGWCPTENDFCSVGERKDDAHEPMGT